MLWYCEQDPILSAWHFDDNMVRHIIELLNNNMGSMRLIRSDCPRYSTMHMIPYYGHFDDLGYGIDAIDAIDAIGALAYICDSRGCCEHSHVQSSAPDRCNAL